MATEPAKKLPIDRHFDCMKRCPMDCAVACKRLAYPKLVHALRKCRELANAESTKGAQTVVVCDDLLAELGEDV